MPASWVDINVSGSNMEGYLTQPEAEGRHPAVVIIQEIWGVNSHIRPWWTGCHRWGTWGWRRPCSTARAP